MHLSQHNGHIAAWAAKRTRLNALCLLYLYRWLAGGWWRNGTWRTRVNAMSTNATEMSLATTTITSIITAIKVITTTIVITITTATNMLDIAGLLRMDLSTRYSAFGTQHPELSTRQRSAQSVVNAVNNNVAAERGWFHACRWRCIKWSRQTVAKQQQ